MISFIFTFNPKVNLFFLILEILFEIFCNILSFELKDTLFKEIPEEKYYIIYKTKISDINSKFIQCNNKTEDEKDNFYYYMYNFF